MDRETVCSCNCLRKIGKEKLCEIRNNYLAKYRTKAERAQFLFDYFSDHEEIPGRYGLLIGLNRVCIKAFLAAYNIKKSTFYELRQKHERGDRTYIHGSRGKENFDSKKIQILAFVDSFVEENGNYMPDGDGNRVYMPPGLKVTDLWNEHRRLLPSGNVCLKYFSRILRENFEKLNFTRTGRFTCSTCVTVQQKIRACSHGNTLVRDRYQLFYEHHLKRQRLQRLQYQKKVQSAIQYPETYVTISTDGADQAKTMTPSSRHPGLKGAFQLKVHVFGSWNFGRSLTFFLDVQDFPHDSNYHCTVLILELLKMKDNLPRNVHLQLDNTCRENKNQIVFSFLGYLVESKILDKVTIGFLLKGHTHQILDQVFSWVSRRILHDPQGILTFQRFCEALSSCYTAEASPFLDVNSAIDIRPSVHRMTKVFAIKEWIMPHSSGLVSLHDSHQFMITRAEDGRAVLRAKQYAESPAWHPAEDEEKMYILKSLPQDFPKLIKPTFIEKQKEAVFSRTDLINQTVKTGVGCGAFSEEVVAEWDKWNAKEVEKEAFYDSIEEQNEDDKADSEKIGDKKNSGGPKIKYCHDFDDVPALQLLKEATDKPEVHLEDHLLHPAVLQAEKEESGQTYEPPRHTGKKRKMKDRPIGSIKAGDYVVLCPNIEHCAENEVDPSTMPWIARVDGDEDEEGNFRITWMHGTISQSWAIGRSKNDKDVQNRNSVVLAGMEFTKKRVLTKKYQDLITEEMEQFQEPYLEELDKLRGVTLGDRISAGQFDNEVEDSDYDTEATGSGHTVKVSIE